jgi:glycosyltransferase involved in cell wall biosynthesis
VRVLWLTPELPFWPGGSGGSTRQHHLIRHLAARGDDVHVVAPVHPSQREGAELLRATGATLHAAERPGSRIAETLGAVARRPALVPAAARVPLLAWQVEVFWTALAPVAARAVADHPPDVVLVEHDWAARWARDLPPGVPKVLALDNLSWRYYERRAQATRGLTRRLLRAEARRFETFDRNRAGDYDVLLTMSTEDDRHVHALTGVPTAVVPNGVDTAALRAAPLPGRPVALFTGTFGYPPNAEALRWLLADIWPRIAARVPGAELLVVGKDPPQDLAAAPGDGVTIAGWVPEMQPWFDRAQAILVPMRSGGGTRLKVLDGLASGRPVVTTTMGAEGIDVTPDEDVVLADGAEGFAAAAARALTDRDLAQRIGANGRRLAETTYDWASIGERLGALLDDLAARGR